MTEILIENAILLKLMKAMIAMTTTIGERMDGVNNYKQLKEMWSKGYFYE